MYVALSFTVIVADEERLACLQCFEMLAADSMKPSKWRRHLNTIHPNDADQPLGFFQQQRADFSQQYQMTVTQKM